MSTTNIDEFEFAEEMLHLKTKIKEWERYFKTKYERAPTRQDIKDRPKLYNLYSRYNHLKDPSRRERQQSSTSASFSTNISLHSHTQPAGFKNAGREPATPSKIINTDFSTGFNGNAISKSRTPSPEKPRILAVGPTPQLHGKVLGIFDMQAVIPRSPSTSRVLFPTAITTSSISISPMNISSGSSNSTFSTPKKSSETPSKTISSSSGKNTIFTPKSHKLDREFESWSKTSSSTVTEIGSPLKNIPDTPSYFNRTSNIFTTSPGMNVGFSPSPIAPQKIQRALSTLIADYKSMQEEDLEEEEEEIMREMELFNEAAMVFAQKQQQIADDENTTPQLYKKRGQKRTTRKSTMKPTPIQMSTEVDNRTTKELGTVVTRPAEGEEGEGYKTEEDDDNEDRNDTKTADEPEIEIKKRKVKQPQENFRRLKLRNSGHKGPRKFPFKRH